MSTAKRAAGIALFVVFLVALLSRPLLSNPAVFGIIEGGLSDWRTLALAGLLVVPTVLLAIARVSSLRNKETEPDRTIPDGEWNVDPRERDQISTENALGDSSSEQTVTDTEQHDADSEDDTSGNKGDADVSIDTSNAAPSFLSGQGGARNREFEIEEQPPDASLGDHLEHLRTELDDPESREDLETLAEVVEETESETVIPARCPQDDCEAAWSERGIIGARTGKYELLDENRIICLECEDVHRLDQE